MAQCMKNALKVSFYCILRAKRVYLTILSFLCNGVSIGSEMFTRPFLSACHCVAIVILLNKRGSLRSHKAKLVESWVAYRKKVSGFLAQRGAISRWWWCWLHRSGRRSSTWPQLHSWHAISSFNAYKSQLKAVRAFLSERICIPNQLLSSKLLC